MNDLVKKLMESIDKPAFIKNELGVYLECNKNFENFLGLSRGEVVGKTVFDIEPTGLAYTDVHVDQELVEAGQTQFYKMPVASVSKSICPITFAKTVFFDDGDKVAGFIGVINIPQDDKYPSSASEPVDHESPKLTRLTKRECEVLFLMSQGLTTKEIGKKLFISNFTASDHLKSIFHKLGVCNRVSAIARAYKMGLI